MLHTSLVTFDLIATHLHFSFMKQVESQGLACDSTSVSGSPYNVPIDQAQSALNTSPEPGPAQPIDPKVDMWHYVDTLL